VNNTRTELFFKSSRLSPLASISTAVGTPPHHRRPPRGASHCRMPPCHLPSATSLTPSHLGKPPLSPPCRAPPGFATGAFPGDPAAFRPPSNRHGLHHRTWPEHGDHAPTWPRPWSWAVLASGSSRPCWASGQKWPDTVSCFFYSFSNQFPI
jgi:hypothetical protein